MTGEGSNDAGKPFALLGDQPHTKGQDPLGFDRIAAELATLVLASRESTPFTLGIEGDWGMGKSSLMKRLESRLKAEPGVKTLWFNAWTAGEGDVLEGLIKSVLERMDASMLRRAARNQSLMSGLRVATRVGARWLRVGDMVDDLWKQMSVDPNARNEMRALVVDAMNQWRSKDDSVPQGRLLCVFVDDLDRCSPGNVFQVFEAIKLYLDAQGLMFVVGYHPAIVSQAILAQKHYGDAVTPREYLEKIVQISYPISAPDDPQAKALVATYVDRSQTATQFEPSARALVIERNSRNPRRIKRFINNFVLRYGLDAEWAEIGATQLIRVQILDMYFPDFARLLARRSETDVLDEFLEYVEVRPILRGGNRDSSGEQWNLVVRAFATQKMRPDDTKPWEQLLEQLEQELPEPYPKLVGDADFIALVRSLADSQTRAKLCAKLARRTTVMIDAAAEAQPASGGLTGDLLWIDDNPANNAGLVGALERSGVRVTEARSGDEARSLLATRARPFDVLISDIGREGRADAGFEDLDAFRIEGLHAGPVVFYAARVTPARRKRAEGLDATVTASPYDLMNIVSGMLGRAAVKSVPA
jgi:CheY-like chemotaxis protein